MTKIYPLLFKRNMTEINLSRSTHSFLCMLSIENDLFTQYKVNKPRIRSKCNTVDDIKKFRKSKVTLFIAEM